MKFLPVLSFPVAVRHGHSVGDFVKSSDLQSETMAWLAENTPVDAVLGPMDLSIEAEAFGARVRFPSDEIPAVEGRLVADADGVAALAVPPPDAKRCGMALEAIRKVKAKGVGKPVYAGMLGPFSLAGRLMDVTEIMYALADEPETVSALLEKVTPFLVSYGKALAAAGADGLFMAEPLAGVISPEALAEFSAPYVKRIVAAIQTDDFPVIYHNCGANVVKAAEAVFGQGARGYHFGNAVDLAAILSRAPSEAWICGNVDPAGVIARGTPETIRSAVANLRASCGACPNFVLSSGCDIPPDAPWANVEAFLEAAHV